jgi:hypothetical protein
MRAASKHWQKEKEKRKKGQRRRLHTLAELKHVIKSLS